MTVPAAEGSVSPASGRARAVSIAAAVLLLVAAIAAAVGILRFADSERRRDLAQWHARLNVVADSRFAAVQAWLDQNLGEMRSIAENQAVQLYLTELSQAKGDRAAVTDEPAQLGYLRNLLVVTAERAGFGGGRGPSVGANVRRTGSGGIALLDADGKALVASPEMPPIDEALARRIADAPKDKPSAIDWFVGASGQPTIGFLAPIFAIQADPGTSARIGYALGLREPGDGFYGLLRQPGATQGSAEVLLVRRGAKGSAYASPLADGTPPLRREPGAEDVASEMRRDLARGLDYRGHNVLAVMRSFDTVPWTLVYKIDRDEALAESDARRRNLIVGLGLLVALTAAAFVAVWWHASSRRATEAAQRYRDLARQFERQEILLRTVTDSQPDLIYLVDGNGAVRFANAAVARRGGVAASALIGKSLADIVGPDHAKRIAEVNRKARKQGQPKSRLMRETREDGSERVVQTGHIPIGRGDGAKSAVLVVERDVTGAVIERERRARALAGVVDALVALIDRRDPYCADHARRVGQVAAAIVEAMGLDPTHRQTVHTAASLMNLGKVLVPTEVLTKTGRLSDAEMRQVRESILHSADFVAGIEFDGPVLQTLRQLQERVDGKGYPQGIKGEAILLPARILAVANAFVSMVSPRAWREAIGMDRAMETLRRDRDGAFDRRVVAALEHVLENAGGAERWRDFARPPQVVKA
ncbi:MAG: PAS domain S-box protein [Alphaproteobacteria bacterium]|nr:PAS domain S-box protein [Alphaproteobacteria bacterium]